MVSYANQGRKDVSLTRRPCGCGGVRAPVPIDPATNQPVVNTSFNPATHNVPMAQSNQNTFSKTSTFSKSEEPEILKFDLDTILNITKKPTPSVAQPKIPVSNLQKLSPTLNVPVINKEPQNIPVRSNEPQRNIITPRGPAVSRENSEFKKNLPTAGCGCGGAKKK